MSISTHLVLGSTPVSGFTTNESGGGFGEWCSRFPSSTLLIYTSGVVLSSDFMGIYTHCLISSAYASD